MLSSACSRSSSCRTWRAWSANCGALCGEAESSWSPPGVRAFSSPPIHVGRRRSSGNGRIFSAFNSWDRITDVESVRHLLHDGGIADCEVAAEDGFRTLRAADEWWTIALGSGLRWAIDQMGPQTAARIKADNVNWLKENKVNRLETNAIYAIGRKPS